MCSLRSGRVVKLVPTVRVLHIPASLGRASNSRSLIMCPAHLPDCLGGGNICYACYVFFCACMLATCLVAQQFSCSWWVLMRCMVWWLMCALQGMRVGWKLQLCLPPSVLCCRPSASHQRTALLGISVGCVASRAAAAVRLCPCCCERAAGTACAWQPAAHSVLVKVSRRTHAHCIYCF